MKTITKGARVALIATSIMLALDGPAYAVTQSSTIRITLRKPVTIALLRDLDFGRLASGTTADTLVVDPTSDARRRQAVSHWQPNSPLNQPATRRCRSRLGRCPCSTAQAAGDR